MYISPTNLQQLGEDDSQNLWRSHSLLLTAVAGLDFSGPDNCWSSKLQRWSNSPDLTRQHIMLPDEVCNFPMLKEQLTKKVVHCMLFQTLEYVQESNDNTMILKLLKYLVSHQIWSNTSIISEYNVFFFLKLLGFLLSIKVSHNVLPLYWMHPNGY